jgi:S-ribosylhomocysteine lyase LuxS involved in autoinducer biosynthesis
MLIYSLGFSHLLLSLFDEDEKFLDQMVLLPNHAEAVPQVDQLQCGQYQPAALEMINCLQ